jgi:hypothetical protein
MLKLSRTWLITTLALGACATEEQPDINSTDLSLTAFDSCEALEQHIEDTAVELMRQSLRGEGGALRGGVDLAAPDGRRGHPERQQQRPHGLHQDQHPGRGRGRGPTS